MTATPPVSSGPLGSTNTVASVNAFGGAETGSRRLGRRRTGGRGVGFIRSQPLGAISLLLIVVFCVAGIGADWLAPYDPLYQHRRSFLSPPSAQHWLGTDDLGRDVLSRIIHGGRVSLIVGFVTVVITMVIGTTAGAISGYVGGRLDSVIQRVMDVVLSIPAIVLLLFIAALLGAGVRNTILALVVVMIPRFNRVARAEMLRIRTEPYVEAARASGATTRAIIARHALPNMFAPLMTIGSLEFASVIIAEASLSFLGIGTPPPTPSWGLMLSEATRYMTSAPWMVIFPGVALSLAVFAFNLLGDALRDHWDPRRKSR